MDSKKKLLASVKKTLGSSKKEVLLTKCNYCNNMIPQRQLQGHIIHCRMVLEKCPRKCGVYVTRQQREFHLSERCSETSSLDRLHDSTNDRISFRKNNKKQELKMLHEIQSEMAELKQKINDEKRSRLKFECDWLSELSKLHERCLQIEEWRGKMFYVLSTLQKSIFQEEKARAKQFNELKGNVKEIYTILQEFEKYVTNLNAQTVDFKHCCLTKSDTLQTQFNSWKKNQEYRWASLHSLSNTIQQLEVDSATRSRSMMSLLDLNELIIDNQEKCSEEVKTCEKDIEGFKTHQNDENTLICKLWHEQSNQLCKLKEDFLRSETVIHELVIWKDSIKKKIDFLESGLEFPPVSENKSKEQNSIVSCNRTDSPLYSNGHLIWCIEEFEEYFNKSKETDVLLHSPKFFSSEYGYKLQMKLYPNGLGQWKGRHTIISLHVLNSEWDSLLDWPVKMHATVTIKDQTARGEQAKDLVKSFGNCVLYREKESTKTLQMFVPHRLLNEENGYIKNGSLILEARVTVIYNFIT